MPDRVDYFTECNEHRVPEEDFRLTFCVRCLQPECVRSTVGKAKFDERVQTWKERLFDQVPRMQVSDPRYPLISGQGFHTLDPAPPAQVSSGWDAPVPAPVLMSVPQSQEAPPASVDPPEASQGEAEEASKVLSAPPNPTPKHMLLMNTPAQPVYTIQPPAGVQPQVKVSVKDPWEAQVQEETTAPVVVQPGARVKLGGSGV